MKKNLIIIGTGLFAEVAKCYFDELSDYQVVGFSCHHRYRYADEIYGLPLYSLEELEGFHLKNEISIFIAIGYKEMNKVRQRVFEEVKALGYSFASFVHPEVKIWSTTSLGDNVFIFENNTIQPFTKIGSNTVLWSGNHIGHHSKIGSHVFISSHVVISGSCIIGNNVFIGVNSTLHDNLTIADETLIGAGAIVSRSTRHLEVFAPTATKVFTKNSRAIGF